MARKKATTAQKLLDAHVQFVLEQFEGGALAALVEKEIDFTLQDAERLRLHDLVGADAVKALMRVYVSGLELSPEIRELVTDIAGRIYAHPVHARTRLSDLLSDGQFGEALGQVLDMKSLGRRLLDEAVSNPGYSALAAEIAYQGIKGYLSQSALTDNIPGARAAMKLGKSMLNRATPGLERSIEEKLKGYVSRNIQSTLAESRRFLLTRFNERSIRRVALDVWDRIKRSRVSVFREFVGQEEVEAFAAMGYDYWLHLRRTDWLLQLIDAGIDSFFERYGERSVGELLAKLGVERGMLVEDAMRLATPAIAGLKKQGLLEPLVRRNLEGFYRSGAVEKILGS